MSSCYNSGFYSKRAPRHYWSATDYHAICWYLTCGWYSWFIMFDSTLNYSSTQLFPSLYPTWLVPLLWLDLISFSLLTLLNSVWFYFFILTRISCPSPSIWEIVKDARSVRPRPHAKYTRITYPYIPGSFNYSVPVRPSSKLITKLNSVSHYLPLARRLL